MWRSGMKFSVSTLASVAVLLTVAGCADFHAPRIDPSGEHLFICDSPPPAAVACPPGTVPTPAPAPPAVAIRPVTGPPLISPYSDVAAMLSPFRTVAPVGGQVVLLGGVRGGDGYLRTNRRLEWSLAPGSVGRFTAIGENRFVDFLVGDFTSPRVVSNTFAIGSTTRVAERTGGPGNSVYVARGQGWITVSSPVEGVSQVTVVAPAVVVPAERAKSASIYWIDAESGFPSPAIIPAGGKQTLTTTVWRQTNHCPRPGWIVRYETVCGPPVLFAPTGTPSIEAPTNEAGQASVEIVEKDPSPGTSQVRVQVFRPADSCGERLMVKESSVLITWTAPSLGIRQMGPPTAAIGQPVTYRLEVSNPGDLPAHDVVATDVVPDGLSFLQANPAPVVEGGRLQWRLGDLAPRQVQIIEATFRTMRPGAVDHCVEVTGAGGLRSSHCARIEVLAAMPGPATIPGPSPATTNEGPRPTPAVPPLSSGLGPTRYSPTSPGPGASNPGPAPTRAASSILDIKVVAREDHVAVGSSVTFDIVLTNHGAASATGIVVRDTFGNGLEHQERSPMTRRLNDLAPGQSDGFGVTFRVTRPGQLCHHVEATAADGARTDADPCVAAVPAAGGAAPAPVTPPRGNPTAPPPPSAPPVLPLEIRVSGPTASTVGKSEVFTAEITNLGPQPIANVVVSQEADAVFAVNRATQEATRQGKVVVWSVPSFLPGRPIRFQVQCECRQPASKACCRFTATPANGQPVVGETCLEIAAATPPAAVAPPAAITGQLSVFVDNFNKIKAGKNQVFLVRVTNQGDSTDNDIIVTAYLPPDSTVVEPDTSGPFTGINPQKGAGQVRFSPVTELLSKATIDYRVVVTTSKPGPISLRVEATSRRQTQPAVGKTTVDVLPAD